MGNFEKNELKVQGVTPKITSKTRIESTSEISEKNEALMNELK